MDSTLNPEQADRQTAVRVCPFTAKTDRQQTWRTLRERNQEMTYWLIPETLYFRMWHWSPRGAKPIHQYPQRERYLWRLSRNIWNITHSLTNKIGQRAMHVPYKLCQNEPGLLQLNTIIYTNCIHIHHYLLSHHQPLVLILSTASWSTGPRDYRVFHRHTYGLVWH